MCNQSVEVEIPCYKYSKRLKRQVQRRDRERERVLKRGREKRGVTKRKEKKRKRGVKRREKKNQGKRSERVVNCQDLLTLPPRARLSIAGIFQLSGAKFGPMRWAGNSCCLDCSWWGCLNDGIVARNFKGILRLCWELQGLQDKCPFQRQLDLAPHVWARNQGDFQAQDRPCLPPAFWSPAHIYMFVQSRSVQE